MRGGSVRHIPRTTRVPILAMVASIATIAACSSAATMQPTPAANIALMARFDSLYTAGAADSDQRANAFELIAQMLAEGAPVQKATISFNGKTFTDSAVAELHVAYTGSRALDSSLFIAMWEGNRPDSVVVVKAKPELNYITSSVYQRSLTNIDFPVYTTVIDTVAVTMATPVSACTSLLADEPPGLNAPVPLSCQAQHFSIQFTTLPELVVQDTVVMPFQRIRDVRTAFDSTIKPLAQR